MRPARITATRSPVAIASVWSWVTNTAGVPIERSSATTSPRICARRFGSRLANGSSSSIRRRCRRQRPGQGDTLALTTGELVRVAAPVAGRGRRDRAIVATRRSRSARGTLRSPKATFWATVRCGNRACSWNTRPMCRRSGSTPARAVVDEGSTDADRAAIDADKPGDESQQRGLATPARTDERQQLVAGQLQVDVIDGDGRPERLGDPVELQRALAHTTAPGSTGGAPRRWSS